ncbi:MAG TPA: exodeoxyribonuclease VII small subunit [Myxococcota bacterium]|nr:exodeoxyribonuclease VII small subunit [Myxococcota bacterium]
MDKEQMTKASFEHLMAELKKTLEILEKGELPLEESMAAYEYGIGLVEKAEEKLSKMEGRMEEILADGSKKALDMNKIMSDQNDAAL